MKTASKPVSTLLNNEGFLRDPGLWSEQVATAIARQSDPGEETRTYM